MKVLHQRRQHGLDKGVNQRWEPRACRTVEVWCVSEPHERREFEFRRTIVGQVCFVLCKKVLQ